VDVNSIFVCSDVSSYSYGAVVSSISTCLVFCSRKMHSINELVTRASIEL
jgi:hypothetical protein